MPGWSAVRTVATRKTTKLLEHGASNAFVEHMVVTYFSKRFRFSVAHFVLFNQLSSDLLSKLSSYFESRDPIADELRVFANVFR